MLNNYHLIAVKNHKSRLYKKFSELLHEILTVKGFCIVQIPLVEDLEAVVTDFESGTDFESAFSIILQSSILYRN